MSGKIKSRRIICLALAFIMCMSLTAGPRVFADTATPSIASLTADQEEDVPIYLDRSYSFEERAADLVSRMTLEEKLSQMISGYSVAIPRLGVQPYGWWNEALHGISRIQTLANMNSSTINNTTSYPISFSTGSSWDRELMYRVASAISDETREVVPGNDTMLSIYSPTVNLIRDPRWGRNDEAISEDPVLTAAMASQFVNGMEGKDMEGIPIDPNGYLKTLTTIKHYLGNNSENNRLIGSSNMTERELREYYSYVYRLIIQQSDVSSVMSSYNRINEVPGGINPYTLDTLLRQTFGFTGFVTSDCDSVDRAAAGSGFDAANPLTQTGTGGHGWRLPDTGEKITFQEALAWAINAGADLECNNGYRTANRDYKQSGPAAIAAQITTPNGLFDENSVDSSLILLFTARIKCGEFDDDTQGVVKWYDEAKERISNYGENWVYSTLANNDGKTITDERVDLAREAAEKSIVLLQNNNVSGTDKKLLPLQIPASGSFKVAVYGHYARPDAATNAFYLGGYSVGMGANGLTKMKNPYNGIKEAILAINPSAEIDFYKGYTGNATTSTGLTTATLDTTNIDKAGQYDLCIVYAGEDDATSKEDRDRISGLLLPGGPAPGGSQGELIKRVATINPKTIAVMETGAPNDVSDFKDLVPAMLWSSYNGQVKGEALANVLLGKYNPSARTTTVWYKTESQIPSIRGYKLTPGEDGPWPLQGTAAGEGKEYTYGQTNGRTYMYYNEKSTAGNGLAGGELQYPFGYGLSYTQFAYSNLKVQGLDGDNSINADGTISVSVDVTNSGSVKGEEVVQLYIPTLGALAELMHPSKRLKAFDKIELMPSETKTVTLNVTIEDLAFYNEENEKFEVYNGDYQVQISRSSSDKDIQLSKNFKVTGTVTPKISVVTAKPNQSGDTEKDIPRRIIFDVNKTVNPQITVAMSDDTLYGYIIKGNSKELPSNITVEYTSNRPSVVAVDDNTIITRDKGVATITATVTDSISGTTGTCDFIVLVEVDENLPYLTELQIGGVKQNNFSRYNYQHEFKVPAGSDPANYQLSAVAGNADWAMEITQPTSIPGTGIIVVTNEYGSVTYTISLAVAEPEEVRIVSAVAENGSITVELNRLPNNLVLSDFTATIGLDAFESNPLALLTMTVAEDEPIVTFTFAPVKKIGLEQLANVAIQYKNTRIVTADFTVEAEGATIIAVTGITVTGSSTTLQKGRTMTLSVNVLPEDATNKTVIWSSSNDKVATVKDGVITGVSSGSVVITVTTEDGSFYQRIPVRIM